MGEQTPVTTTPPPESDTWIDGRFRLDRKIGTGGLSAVYAGWDQKLRRPVAVKVMHRSPNSRALREQAWREAMTTATLRHPNMVMIYDYGIEKERAYVVMELLEGENLEQCLSRGPLHMGDFYNFARQSLNGIAAAHEAGFVHRDLKPGNFMLVRDDSGGVVVKILDFGLAKYLKTPQPQSTDHYNSLLGSIHYMAPEQFERRPLDHRTDIYSLGCIFYEALTAHNAFDGDSVAGLIGAHLRSWPMPVQELRPDAPKELEAWVFDFLKKDQNERHTTARSALEEMPQQNAKAETQRIL